MRKLIATIVLGLSIVASNVFAVITDEQRSAKAENNGWGIDYEVGLKNAKKAGRPALVYFTGSDWCQYCILLNKEVLGTKEFKEWATKNVELIVLDFPQSKYQSEKDMVYNYYLSQKYGVEGYPTLFLVDSTGKPFGKTGYEKGGVELYLKNLDKMMEDFKKK